MRSGLGPCRVTRVRHEAGPSEVRGWRRHMSAGAGVMAPSRSVPCRTMNHPPATIGRPSGSRSILRVALDPYLLISTYI